MQTSFGNQSLAFSNLALYTCLFHILTNFCNNFKLQAIIGGGRDIGIKINPGSDDGSDDNAAHDDD